MRGGYFYKGEKYNFYFDFESLELDAVFRFPNGHEADESECVDVSVQHGFASFVAKAKAWEEETLGRNE